MPHMTVLAETDLPTGCDTSLGIPFTAMATAMLAELAVARLILVGTAPQHLPWRA
jgi:hypothetical protein